MVQLGDTGLILRSLLCGDLCEHVRTVALDGREVGAELVRYGAIRLATDHRTAPARGRGEQRMNHPLEFFGSGSE